MCVVAAAAGCSALDCVDSDSRCRRDLERDSKMCDCDAISVLSENAVGCSDGNVTFASIMPVPVHVPVRG